MKFKTQETRDKNNVIKLYKWGKNPDNFGLISCSGYLILPLSRPLCPPPADLLSLPLAARMYHLRRSLFGVWPKPSSYAGRYLLTKQCSSPEMLRVQIICKQLCSAELLLGHIDLGAENTATPVGELAVGQKKTNKRERLRRKR